MSKTQPVTWRVRGRNLFVSVWTALWLYLSLGMVLLSFSAIQFQAQIEDDARRTFDSAAGKALQASNGGAVRITVAQIELGERHYHEDLELLSTLSAPAKMGAGDPKAGSDVAARVSNLTRELYPKLFPNAAAVPDDVIKAIQESCRTPPESTKDLCQQFDALVTTPGQADSSADSQGSLRNRILAVQDRIDGYERSTVYTEAAEIQGYQKISQFFFPWFPMLLPALPHPILVMIVTLSMGALGSALFMLQIQLAGKPAGYQSTVSWHIFRPLQGMASALAIFLLVRAGQISISHAGGASADDTDLNAYVLGFIGVVSGLLSDRAMDRLTAAGANLLTTQGAEQTKPQSETDAEDTKGSPNLAPAAPDPAALATPRVIAR